jgi:hypothetical protein
MHLSSLTESSGLSGILLKLKDYRQHASGFTGALSAVAPTDPRTVDFAALSTQSGTIVRRPVAASLLA